ncbi:MAG TPA: hypothetical protein DDZ89_22100, partial [Clostridiales bacterium]|nr:hypothetical protein [Clostridiales bacterium]
DEVDTFTGYRYYSPSKIDECNKILALKELGFTLDEINKQLKVTHSSDLLDIIRHKEKELLAAKIEIEHKLNRLGSLKEMIANRDEKMFNVIIQKTDSLRVAYQRNIFHHKEDAYQTIKKMHLVVPSSITGRRSVLINYASEYTENDFDIAVGVEITGPLSEGCEFADKILKFDLETASLVCNKDELDEAYLYIHKYIHENNCQIAGPFYEMFHQDGTIELKVPVGILSKTKNSRIRDNTKIAFQNDPLVIGRWELYDLLPSRDFFSTEKKNFTGRKTLKELYFLPEGDTYWCYEWTKGYLITSFGNGARQLNKYTIEQVDNKAYMFIEMKSSRYYLYNGLPDIWVFVQTDHKMYKKDEIRIRDNTNMPFIHDEQVLGQWTVCDYVDEIQLFSPNVPPRYPKNVLYWRTVEFVQTGNCKLQFTSDHIFEKPRFTWTKSYILDHETEVAQAYEIRSINESEYLFVEWKSGDYVFARKEPSYYVFKKI